MMGSSITNPETMLSLQGDFVLVNKGKDEKLLSIVRVMDVGRQHLLLVNRESKKRESWELTQALYAQLCPSKDKRAKWELSAAL